MCSWLQTQDDVNDTNQKNTPNKINSAFLTSLYLQDDNTGATINYILCNFLKGGISEPSPPQDREISQYGAGEKDASP